MKILELITVTMMVINHIDTTCVTHSLHKGLILCQIEGIFSSIARLKLIIVGRDNLTTFDFFIRVCRPYSYLYIDIVHTKYLRKQAIKVVPSLAIRKLQSNNQYTHVITPVWDY